MTIQTWLKESTFKLADADIESARLDAHLLIEHALDKPKSWIIAHDNEVIDTATLETLGNNLARRINHVPIAYILGSKEFYGRSFYVDERVLIPRPDSEALITLCKDVSSTKNERDWIIVDVGTGSGILAITAQLEIPSSKVYATDISIGALQIAKLNAADLAAHIQFILCDLLELPEAIFPNVILANLPYVPDNLITSEEIKTEPALALFSGKDGLGHYKRFWNQAATLKSKPRYIITESLEPQHADLAVLAQAAQYTQIRTLGLAQLFEAAN